MSAVISPPEAHVLELSSKSSTSTALSLDLHHRTRSSRAHPESREKQNDAIKEVQDLKEQLEALRCQVSEYLSTDCHLKIPLCGQMGLCEE